MRTVEVVRLEPGRELLISFFRVDVVADVSPLAESGLDEALGFAVGARGVGTGKTMADAELLTGGTKTMGAVAMAVVGEQAANGDAVLGIKSNGRA